MPLVRFINNNLDILMTSETNTDGTFPGSQFLIKGFSVPYRLIVQLIVKGLCNISERIYLLNV